MKKAIIIFCILIGIISCRNNYHNRQITTTYTKDIESSRNTYKDSTFEEHVIPKKDSIELEKVEKRLTQTKWYKEVLHNSKKVSIMILPPNELDTLHYWFKVGDNRSDRFMTFRNYATKKGEWELLYYDTEINKLILVKD